MLNNLILIFLLSAIFILSFKFISFSKCAMWHILNFLMLYNLYVDFTE